MHLKVKTLGSHRIYQIYTLPQDNHIFHIILLTTFLYMLNAMEKCRLHQNIRSISYSKTTFADHTPQ